MSDLLNTCKEILKIIDSIGICEDSEDTKKLTIAQNMLSDAIDEAIKDFNTCSCGVCPLH